MYSIWKVKEKTCLTRVPDLKQIKIQDTELNFSLTQTLIFSTNNPKPYAKIIY